MTRGRRSELELFQALPDGAPADLADFSSRLRRCAHWVLNRMSGGRSLSGEVDDIVGEAHLRLEQLRTRGFQGGALEFRTYLYKVVVSACVAAANGRRFTDSLDAPVELPDGDAKPLSDVLQAMVDPHLSAPAELEGAEERTRVRQALGGLDDRCRRLLERFHLEEVPISELARREQTRPNTIEVALTRCRQRLYAAFLRVYLDAADPDLKPRVARVTEALGELPGRVFRAWWAENRSVTDIGKEIDRSPAETRRLLARAKLEVWRRLGEGRPG